MSTLLGLTSMHLGTGLGVDMLALPGKTLASSQPTVYSRELPVASPFPKQSDKIQRITNR